MRWNVTVTRTAVASRDIEVDADTREQAEAKALEMAGDLDYSGCVVDYDFDVAGSTPVNGEEEVDGEPTPEEGEAEVDLDSELKRCPDLGDGTCALCPTVFPGVSDEIIDAGWVPSYWIGEEEQEGPVCPNCAKQFLVNDPQYGESVLCVKGTYISQWDGGVEVESPCTVDPRTRKITILQASSVEGLETCERECVKLNGVQYEAANEDERDQFIPEEQSRMFFWQ
jgi:hypothetical protein